MSIPTGHGGRLSINGCWPGGSGLFINRTHVASEPSQLLRFITATGFHSERNHVRDKAAVLPFGEGTITPTLAITPSPYEDLVL